jgi:hypothetical protein
MSSRRVRIPQKAASVRLLSRINDLRSSNPTIIPPHWTPSCNPKNVQSCHLPDPSHAARFLSHRLRHGVKTVSRGVGPMLFAALVERRARCQPMPVQLGGEIVPRALGRPHNTCVFMLLHKHRLIMMRTNEEFASHLMLFARCFLLTGDPSTL